MEKTIINQYKSEFCDGSVVVERGILPSDAIPERLAGRFVSPEVSIDWIYKFDTDEFMSTTRGSINKDNSYVINKIEDKVRLIALEILADNSIDVSAIQQAIADAKAADEAERLALEQEIELEDITPIAEA